jgi:hypothetical protein
MMDVSGMIHAQYGKDFVEVISYVEVKWNLLNFVMVPFHCAFHLRHLSYLKQSHQESACTVMGSASGLGVVHG